MTRNKYSAIFATTGNDDCHIILRGGKEPNFDTAHVAQAIKERAAANVQTRLMIDCSHANSQKDHQRQIDVAKDIAKQISSGNENIMGVMIESHLVAGRQDVQDGKELVYGQSVTDACINWEDSLSVLKNLADAVKQRRASK